MWLSRERHTPKVLVGDNFWGFLASLFFLDLCLLLKFDGFGLNFAGRSQERGQCWYSMYDEATGR